MARIFISHSSHDGAAAAEIMSWLRGLGFDNAFLDIDEATGITPGQKWESRLYEELAACSAVVLLVTPHWLASKWCFAEFVQARATGKAIFPIVMTPDGGQMFASDIQRVDFSTDREKGKRSLAQRLKELALDVQSGFDWDPRRPPYPGLPAFEREDAAVYFGRDPETRELIDRLRARRAVGGARLIAVLGASGSGKSSLVRAGVLPRLAKFETDFAVLPPIRPGADPLIELAKAMAEAQGQPTQWRAVREWLAQPGDALHALVDDLLIAAGRREGLLLVTLDQAEELFTSTPAEARDAFADWLRRAAPLPLLVLLTLRSDRLGEWQQFAQPVGEFEQFSLPPLPAARLAPVIEGPARVAGIRLAPGVVDALLHDAGAADSMPLLAFTLRELWSRARADAGGEAPTIRLADYRALGDPTLNPLENAVRRRADQLVAGLDAGQRQVLREAFVGALARIDDQGVYGRRSAAWDQLDPAVHVLLDAFVQARLLVARDDDGRRSVEVAHESLLRKWPLLAGWLDEERDFMLGRLQLQRALDDWQSASPADRDSALLHGLMLERSRQWLRDKARSLSAPQRDFIAASIARAAAIEHAARRRRWLLGSSAAAALAVIGALAVYLHFERRQSSQLAVEVEADLWLQRSAAALAYGQPDRALAQAAQAYQRLPGAKTRSALWQAGTAIAPQRTVRFPPVGADGAIAGAGTAAAVSALAFAASPDELVVGDRSGALYTLGLRGDALLRTTAAQRLEPPSKDVPEAVLALQIRPDGARLAVLEDGRVLRQAAGAAQFDVLTQVEPLFAAAIGKSGLLLLGQADRRLRWLDCGAMRCTARELPDDALQPVDALAVDQGGSRYAAAGEDGTVVVGSADAAVPSKRLALPAGTRVSALAFDSGGGRLAVATGAGEVRVFDRGGAQTAQLPTFSGGARQLRWAPGGERLAVACEDQSVCVWRFDAGGEATLSAVLAAPGNAALAWSADGRRLAGGNLNGALQVWDLAAPADRSAVLRADGAGALADIDVHADGRRIAAADVRGRAFVWDLPSLQLQKRLQHPLPGESRGVLFDPVQPRLALGTLGGGVAVFALDSGALVGQIDGSIEALRWAGADGRLLTGGQDGVVRSHAVGSGQASVLPLAHADAVVALAVAPTTAGGPAAVHSADTRGVLLAHTESAGAPQAALAPLAIASNAAGQPFSVNSLSFTPDGRRMLAAGSSGEVLLFDRDSRQLLKRLHTGADQINSAAISPDGRFIAAIDNIGRLLVWQLPDATPYATLALRHEPGRIGNDRFGLLGQLRHLAWLGDSRRVAIATQSGVAVVIGVPVDR